MGRELPDIKLELLGIFSKIVFFKDNSLKFPIKSSILIRKISLKFFKVFFHLLSTFIIFFWFFARKVFKLLSLNFKCKSIFEKPSANLLESSINI